MIEFKGQLYGLKHQLPEKGLAPLASAELQKCVSSEIYSHLNKILFLATYFLYPFLNYFRTPLWGTYAKYLFIMGLYAKLHSPVEFSSHLPFVLSHQYQINLLLMSVYLNTENMQLGQRCWKLELCRSIKNSWM